MNKREAKKWACGMAADLLRSDLSMGEVIAEPGVSDDPDPDYKVKRAAMNELIDELERRGGQR